MYAGMNQYRVVMEVDAAVLAAAPRRWTRSTSRRTRGSSVPLSTVAKFGRSTTPLSVNHQGQFPAITLSFNLMPGASLGDAVAADRRRGA